MDKKLLAEYVEKMKECVKMSHDPEMAHSLADDLLCDFLEKLGYGELTDIFNDVQKWYA